MRLYLLAFFLILSCKWTESSSKQATSAKAPEVPAESLPTLPKTEHPPIPEARPSAMETLKREANDETKRAKRVALKAALDRLLNSEDLKGMQSDINAALASGESADTHTFTNPSQSAPRVDN